MNGKENIINKILADADAKCEEILTAAQAQAQEIHDSARSFAKNEEDALNSKLQNISAERLRNANARAQLEARKYKLWKKQQLIASCYAQALKELAALPVPQKTAFLKKLIEAYAEKGETVRITKADKDIVTQKFLDTFGKKLTLGKSFIEASGGIVLEGEGYDKDLTLEKVVAYAREQTEAQVARTLFGD